jgi:hypothetical protein
MASYGTDDDAMELCEVVGSNPPPLVGVPPPDFVLESFLNDSLDEYTQ